MREVDDSIRLDTGRKCQCATKMKDVRFVFAEDYQTLLCRGDVAASDRLFNPLPSEKDPEPSFLVEKITGNVMTAHSVQHGRSGTMKFRCLTEAEWEKRFA